MARGSFGDPPSLLQRAAGLGRRGRRKVRERLCRLAVRRRRDERGHMVIRMLAGRDLYVDPADKGLSRSLARDGYWEMWLTEALEATLKPGMIAIDIGANVGYFAMRMADLVGASGHVHAFEPNPDMADLLAMSAARAGLDGRLTLHRDALWDGGDERALLRVPAGEPKNAHLVTHFGADDAGVRVSLRRFDSYPALLDADVIKIDVEGAEEHVWRGMAGLFARGRPLTIFLEFSPIRYADPMAFLDAIRAQGFALAELSVSHGIRAVGADDILAGDSRVDRMLALTRGATR